MTIIPCNINIKEFTLKHTSGPLKGVTEEYVAISILTTDEAIWHDIEEGHNLEGTPNTIVVTMNQYYNIFHPLFNKISESNREERTKHIKFTKAEADSDTRYTTKGRFKIIPNLGGYCIYASCYEAFNNEQYWQYIGWEKTLKGAKVRITNWSVNNGLAIDKI